MNITRVSNKRDLKTFVELPYHLYRNDPGWVPPLRDEQFGQFDPKRNPFLDHCEYSLFLLEDGSQPIGRVAAFFDRLENEFCGQLIGHFGSYECIQNGEASRLLLTAAQEWLKSRQMPIMRGPWSFVSQEWGLVVEGFTPPPVVMAPYNPPWYANQMESHGLAKVKDLLCYSISAVEGYKIPERILNLTDRVAERYGVHVRQVDMKRFDDEVNLIIDLSNRSIIDNWGYSPVTEPEVRAMARDLRPIIQPKGVLFAEDKKGQPIGFAIALPDANTLLKGLNGRLFPFGFIKLLAGLPRLHRYRMFALGVIPEYHGKAIDSLLYRALYESIFSPEMWMEINYVLEDNDRMNNAILKLNAKPLRRYRIYEKPI